MALKPTYHIQASRGENVRIGPISIITLIVVICMAVLAVLAASTSNASAAISTRMADGTQMLYANEKAGQEFVAGIDSVLVRVRANNGDANGCMEAIDRNLDDICAAARKAGGGEVQCTADVDGMKITAQFVCGDTRQLSVAITIQSDTTYRIEKWEMASTQQDSPVAGTLWSGA